MKKKDNESVTLYANDEKHADAFLTPWSLVHFLSGAAMKGLGFSLPVAFVVHGLYEVKDQGNHAKVYNSVTNSMGDQVVAMLGWNWIKDTNTPRWTYYWLIAWGIAATMGEDIG